MAKVAGTELFARNGAFHAGITAEILRCYHERVEVAALESGIWDQIRCPADHSLL